MRTLEGPALPDNCIRSISHISFGYPIPYGTGLQAGIIVNMVFWCILLMSWPRSIGVPINFASVVPQFDTPINPHHQANGGEYSPLLFCFPEVQDIDLFVSRPAIAFATGFVFTHTHPQTQNDNMVTSMALSWHFQVELTQPCNKQSANACSYYGHPWSYHSYNLPRALFTHQPWVIKQLSFII